MDISGAELVCEEAALQREMGGDRYLYRLKESAGTVVDRGGCRDVIGERDIHDPKGRAIAAIYQKPDRDLCAACTRRVFRECSGLAAGATADQR